MNMILSFLIMGGVMFLVIGGDTMIRVLREDWRWTTIRTNALRDESMKRHPSNLTRK